MYANTVFYTGLNCTKRRFCVHVYEEKTSFYDLF